MENPEPHHYFYNLPEFSGVIEQTKHHSAIKIACINVDQVCNLGEISREAWDFAGIFQRTVYYTEPICLPADASFEATVKQIAKASRGLFIQVRPQRVLSEIENNILIDNGFQRQDHLNAIIQIRETELMWANLERDKQKRIRQARERHHLVVREDNSSEAIDCFYKLLKSLYAEKRHPIKSCEYFHNLINLMPPGVIRLWFVYYNGIPVTAQLAAFYGSRITALYTASDPVYRDKQGGDLMIWSLLEYGWQNDFSVFDFGGGGDPNRPYQPREYKKRFGTVFTNVGRYTKANSFLYTWVERAYRLLLR